jgi:5-methylcytosine-specific restriction endonuclease McrA
MYYICKAELENPFKIKVRMIISNFIFFYMPYLGSEKSDLTCFSLASNHATQVGFFYTLNTIENLQVLCKKCNSSKKP